MTRDDWESLLDEDPMDQQRRVEYADWCEENGFDKTAKCQRWMLKRNRRAFSAVSRRYGWFSWTTTERSEDGEDLSEISVDLVAKMGGEKGDSHAGLGRWFNSRRTAEEALADVLTDADLRTNDGRTP